MSQSCYQNSYNSDLIDINGICNAEDITAILNTYPYWMQMSIPETVKIPPLKPDMESINGVNVSVDIARSEVIKTPIGGPNLEGKSLTGRKIIIEGQVAQQVEYTANDPEQSVHSAHFYVPFSSYIVVPQLISFTQTNGSTILVDSINLQFQVSACVEDVSLEMLDERTIIKHVTLLLYAIPVGR